MRLNKLKIDYTDRLDRVDSPVNRSKLFACLSSSLSLGDPTTEMHTLRVKLDDA